MEAHAIIAPLAGTAVPGSAVDRQLSELYANAKDAFSTTGFAFSWYVVMLAAFTEAFLHDVLAAAACVDPTLMERSEQKVTYLEVTSSNSLPELEEQMRSRWARAFVDDGGPTRWSTRLEKMGAGPLQEVHVRKLEELWGSRHVVVHRVGKVDVDFVRRHPQLGFIAGQDLQVAKEQVLDYVETSGIFVKWVDDFAAARWPRLSA